MDGLRRLIDWVVDWMGRWVFTRHDACLHLHPSTKPQNPISNTTTNQNSFPIPGAYKVGLNPPFRKLSKAHAELEQIESSVLETRRAEHAALRGQGLPLPPSRDLLDVYLEAIEEEERAASASGGAAASHALNDASIFRNINDVFLVCGSCIACVVSAAVVAPPPQQHKNQIYNNTQAGSDTTATTISATLFEIVRRPQVLARVEAELASLDIDNPAHMLPLALTQRCVACEFVCDLVVCVCMCVCCVP